MKQMKWIETHDKRALEPEEPIICIFCRHNEHTKENASYEPSEWEYTMIHRFASIGPIRAGSDATEEDKSYVVRMIYKCPICNFIAHFDRAISEEYFNELLEILPGENLRPDNRRYEPTREELKRQLPGYAKKRMEELGYF